MALGLATHFLLFLWFSGVNHFVYPSTEAGSGMSPDYPQHEPEETHRGDLYLSPPHHLRALSLPPSHVDPLQDEPFILRRQYRLEDFLWTGSGDGPHPSEVDGGLAWEDNGGGLGTTPHFNGASAADSQKNYIRVTKTMTLYRTVLTTIYPVEVTPTVISGHLPPTPTPVASQPEPTPSLPPGDALSPSESLHPESSLPLDPTPVYYPTLPPEPTAAPPFLFPSTSPPPDTPPSSDNLSEAASTDPVFWIQTSIKANASSFRDTPRVFQRAMQKNLAQVYAKAFKRHLLATLGVLPPPSSINPAANKNRRRRRKKRSWGYHAGDPDIDEDDHIHQWLYVAQSSMSPTQLKQLATAAMNVTVTLLNVTEDAPPKVDLKYVVLAEGSPVPAFSAVKELELVSKREMEEMLGYDIINKKAEALVAGPPEQMTRNEQYVATSPWLIVAVTTICLLVVLLALIGFMVWKWKHNRLGDAAGGGRRQIVSSAQTPARPQSGTGQGGEGDDARGREGRGVGGGGDDENEEGVINPAFLGTPKRTGRAESLDRSPKSSPTSRSLLSARHRALTATKRISEVLTRLPSSKTRTKVITPPGGIEDPGDDKKDTRKPDRWNSPSSSEELRGHRKVTAKPSLTSSEGSADWKELLGEPRPKMPAGSGRKRSPTRAGGGKGAKPPGGSAAAQSKEMLRRRRKKSKVAEEANLRTDFEGEEEDDDEEDEGTGNEEKGKGGKAQPWTKGITDAISLGNLDIFQDSAIAQTPSEYARKLVPWKRPGSAVGSGAGPSSSSQPYFLPTGILEGHPRRGTPGSSAVRIQTIDEVPTFDQLDRELSERSESPPAPPTASPPVDTKEQGVQTPTRISKTASHKQRAAAKPRKNWKGSPGGESSVISTESEEIVEVHHVPGGLPEEENPLGRMRKRFHQFLDDAFNVMGGREVPPGGDDGPPPRASTSRKTGRAGETQSAKVSISHEVVETETEWRPWTSHVIREETLQKLKRGRPKSAAVPAQVLGPPKRAWTDSSERRSHSAKGGASRSTGDLGGSRVASVRNLEEDLDFEDEEESSYDKTSTREGPKVPGSSATVDPQSTSLSTHSQSVILSPAFIFPQYPTYPDIRVTMGSAASGGGGGAGPISSSSTATTGSSTISQTQSHPPPPSLPPNDPAVPLIQAIKNEMKRFEKDPPPGGGGSSDAK